MQVAVAAIAVIVVVAAAIDPVSALNIVSSADTVVVVYVLGQPASRKLLITRK